MKERLLMLGALLLSVLLATTSSSFAQRLVTPLETNLDSLVADFNARASGPRLVVILSPT